VIFGYAYLFIGIIITTFMAGLAAGAHFSKQCNMKNWRKMLLFLQFFSGIYLLVIALKLELMSDTLGVALIQTLFLLMILAISLLVGLQYGVSVCKSERSVGVTIAQIYSADLIGAATGSLLVVIWLIPVFGLLTNLVILGLLHFLTLTLFVVKRKLKYF
jgi:predicted membrane-bound spermidine synthase